MDMSTLKIVNESISNNLFSSPTLQLIRLTALFVACGLFLLALACTGSDPESNETTATGREVERLSVAAATEERPAATPLPPAKRERSADSARPSAQRDIRRADVQVVAVEVQPAEVIPGGPVVITVSVENRGDGAGTDTLELYIDGDVHDSHSLTLQGGENKRVVFEVRREEARTYTVRVANQSGTFKVRPAATAKAPNELVRVGDFSVALVDVEREEQETWLKFALTKLGDLNEPLSPLAVTLIDDHGNGYEKAWLTFELGLGGVGERGDALASLPRGFTYTTKVGVSIPRLAPIEVLKLGDENISFGGNESVPPQLLGHANEHYVGEGRAVNVGKWLTFSRGQIVPSPSGGWQLEVDVENGDYSPRTASVYLGVQFQNADIIWGRCAPIRCTRSVQGQPTVAFFPAKKNYRRSPMPWYWFTPTAIRKRRKFHYPPCLSMIFLLQSDKDLVNKVCQSSKPLTRKVEDSTCWVIPREIPIGWLEAKSPLAHSTS